MKPVVVVVVVGLFAVLAIHVTAEHDMSKFLEMVKTCKTKTGATDEDVKNIKPNKVPQTKIEQCYSGCLNHELGLVFPNNTVNVENVKVLYAALKEKNPDFYEKSIKVAEICASKVTANSDDCAAAKVITECYVNESEKIGLKLDGEHDMSKFLEMVKTCKSKTGATDEDVKNIKPNKVPQTQIEQCYSGCLNHELGFVFPNNTLNVENITKFYASFKGKNPDFCEKSIKVAEICASKVTANSDDCAAAKVIAECYVNEAEKIGLKLDGSQ